MCVASTRRLQLVKTLKLTIHLDWRLLIRCWRGGWDMSSMSSMSSTLIQELQSIFLFASAEHRTQSNTKSFFNFLSGLKLFNRRIDKITLIRYEHAKLLMILISESNV